MMALRKNTNGDLDVFLAYIIPQNKDIHIKNIRHFMQYLHYYCVIY